MLIGKCPHCDNDWYYGWDEKHQGYYILLCKKCKKSFWIELGREGITRTHEQFLIDIAIPDGKKEKAEKIQKQVMGNENGRRKNDIN